MKTTQQKMSVQTLLIFALAFGGFTIGCGQKKSGAAEEVATTPATPVDDAVDPNTPSDDSGDQDSEPSDGTGDTVTFKPVSISEMNKYVATRPLNNPTNFKININLDEVESLRFAGTVRISYRDNGIDYEGIFNSGTGRNASVKSLKDNDVLESHYNYWFRLDGRTVFSGFFQDNYGGIVLVIDKSVNQGDGQGSGSTVSGSIWYRNFAQTFAPQSTYRKCWFVYSGPYNCRSNAVIQKNSLSIDGYTKLGTFSGLSRTRAFNLN